MSKAGIIWKKNWDPKTGELTFENVGRVVHSKSRAKPTKEVYDRETRIELRRLISEHMLIFRKREARER